jgi:hypothetical protein
MRAFKDISHSLMVGEISAEQATGESGVKMTEEVFKNKGTNISTSNLPNGLAKHLQITIHQYDAYGRLSKETQV